MAMEHFVSTNGGNAGPYSSVMENGSLKQTQNGTTAIQHNVHPPRVIADMVPLCSRMFPPLLPNHSSLYIQQRTMFHLLSCSDATLVQKVRLFVIAPRRCYPQEETVGPYSKRAHLLLSWAASQVDWNHSVGVQCIHCAATLDNQDKPPPFGSTWFVENPKALEVALQHVKQHLLQSCPYVSFGERECLIGTRANAQFYSTMSLEQFVPWYCSEYKLFHKEQTRLSLTPMVVAQQETSQTRTLRSIPNQQSVQKTLESFDELQHAQSHAFSKHNHGRLGGSHPEVVIFSCLNDIPWSESLAETPFVSHLLDCLELVHEDLTQTTDGTASSESCPKHVYTMQCRYCHGKGQEIHNAKKEWIPRLRLHPELNPLDAAGWLQAMGQYHCNRHHGCTEIPQQTKACLSTLGPKMGSKAFDKDTIHFQKRFQEWMVWIRQQQQDQQETKLDTDVELLVPLTQSKIQKLGSRFAEPNATIPTITETPTSTIDFGLFGVKDNDVIVNVERAQQLHVGNRRFRLLVSEFRRKYWNRGSLYGLGPKNNLILVQSLLGRIQQRGGTLGHVSLARRCFEPISPAAAVEICSKALQEGVSKLLLRPTLVSREETKRRPGSLVLEQAVAPHFGILNQTVVWPGTTENTAESSCVLTRPIRKRRHSGDFNFEASRTVHS